MINRQFDYKPGQIDCYSYSVLAASDFMTNGFVWHTHLPLWPLSHVAQVEPQPWLYLQACNDCVTNIYFYSAHSINLDKANLVRQKLQEFGVQWNRVYVWLLMFVQSLQYVANKLLASKTRPWWPCLGLPICIMSIHGLCLLPLWLHLVVSSKRHLVSLHNLSLPVGTGQRRLVCNVPLKYLAVWSIHRHCMQPSGSTRMHHSTMAKATVFIDLRIGCSAPIKSTHFNWPFVLLAYLLYREMLNGYRQVLFRYFSPFTFLWFVKTKCFLDPCKGHDFNLQSNHFSRFFIQYIGLKLLY